MTSSSVEAIAMAAAGRQDKCAHLINWTVGNFSWATKGQPESACSQSLVSYAAESEARLSARLMWLDKIARSAIEDLGTILALPGGGGGGGGVSIFLLEQMTNKRSNCERGGQAKRFINIHALRSISQPASQSVMSNGILYSQRVTSCLDL